MHVQVLTGDKQETAINIGYSCNLINEDMRMWVISTSFPDLEHLEAGGQEAEAAQMASERVGEQLAQVRQGGGGTLCTVQPQTRRGLQQDAPHLGVWCLELRPQLC